jgi:hypothetical protein
MSGAYERERAQQGEVITEEIRDVDSAYSQIVLDAKNKVKELDWARLGITDEDIEIGALGYGLALRNAPYHLPLTVLIDRPGHERGLMMNMLPDQKKHLAGDYWLGMLNEAIPAGYATFTRDHLFLKIPEMVIAAKGLDLHESADRIIEGGPRSPLMRAAARLTAYMVCHPDVLR